jgi:hypothetical protein
MEIVFPRSMVSPLKSVPFSASHREAGRGAWDVDVLSRRKKSAQEAQPADGTLAADYPRGFRHIPFKAAFRWSRTLLKLSKVSDLAEA